jgi:ATP adenylyltransferase
MAKRRSTKRSSPVSLSSSSRASRSKTKSSKPLGRAAVTKPVSSDDLSEKIREEIWPVERNVFFRPERLRYVRKMIRPKGCVFCAAVEAGLSPESLLIYKDDKAIVVLNKFPYNAGHLLVLPRRHCGEFLDLSGDEHEAISACLRMSIQALTEVYGPSGFNVGLNLGSAAGAGIPEHLHYHVIPRWSGDTNFFPLIADTKVVVENLEQTYARLLPYFEGIQRG